MTTAPEQAKKLGQHIRTTRNARKMTLRELANRTAVPKTTLLRLEKGEVTHPRLDLVSTIAVTLKVAPADLYALLGAPVNDDLPDLPTYLYARYNDLSPAALAEIQTYLEEIAEREGIDLDSTPAQFD